MECSPSLVRVLVTIFQMLNFQQCLFTAYTKFLAGTKLDVSCKRWPHQASPRLQHRAFHLEPSLLELDCKVCSDICTTYATCSFPCIKELSAAPGGTPSQLILMTTSDLDRTYSNVPPAVCTSLLFTWSGAVLSLATRPAGAGELD